MINPRSTHIARLDRQWTAGVRPRPLNRIRIGRRPSGRSQAGHLAAALDRAARREAQTGEMHCVRTSQLYRYTCAHWASHHRGDVQYDPTSGLIRPTCGWWELRGLDGTQRRC